MAYIDKYRNYLESVPDVIERCRASKKRPVLAYTSNLDAIVKWDVDSFNRLLERYLEEEPCCEEGEAVGSMQDFAKIVSYYAVNGLGGEVEITSGGVIERLKDYFDIYYGLGGTCAQGAAALGTLGVPVLIHITDRSREVAKWLEDKRIESVNGHRSVPIKECVTGEKPLIHLIMQYDKGDVIRCGDREYEVPVSNRLIMGYDKVHKVMPVRQDFLEYLEEHAQMMCSYDISGFNAIVEPEVLKERIGQLAKHYRTLRSRNPQLKIYFESAHFISAGCRDLLYGTLAGHMDIMGMNEEELVDLAGKKACPVDKDDIRSVIKGLDHMLELYPVKGIVMHSKDYALYYGEMMEGVDVEMGLTLGSLMSGTRARIGRYGTIDDCRESLKLPLSPTGIRFAQALDEMELQHEAVLVPSRYMEKPRYTIGLGDTFVAGMQLCFM